MSYYFVAVALLFAATFIHDRCTVPELRPENATADRIWRRLSKLAHYAAWGLLLYGAWLVYHGRMHWTLILASFVGAVALRLLIAQGGPRRIWPGLSMGFAVAGLVAGVVAVLRH